MRGIYQHDGSLSGAIRPIVAATATAPAAALGCSMPEKLWVGKYHKVTRSMTSFRTKAGQIRISVLKQID